MYAANALDHLGQTDLARQSDADAARPLQTDFFEQFCAVHTWHKYIRNDDIDRLKLHDTQCIWTVVLKCDDIPLWSAHVDHTAQSGQYIGFVIDQKDL